MESEVVKVESTAKEVLKEYTLLMQSEIDRLSGFQKAFSLLTMCALVPIVLYFSNKPLFSIEEITETSDENISLAKAKAEVSANLKRYLQAASRIPFFYRIASLPLVGFFSTTHVLANVFLRATLTWRVWRMYYFQFANQLADPRWLRDVALDFRPFLTWLLLVPPVAIVMLAYRSLTSVREALYPAPQATRIKGVDCFRFAQQLDQRKTNNEKEFFYSPWFTPVAIAPFLLGIPAAISYYLYWHFSLDALFGFPSHSSQFIFVFPFICLYLTSLGWAISSLFFRSYFTFALSYTSTEYDIEVYSDVIKKLPVKGWFADFITFRGIHTPSQLSWRDVTSIKLSGSSEPAKLHLLTKNPYVSTFLKVGEIFESIARKIDIHNDYLTIESNQRQIIIRLWELSAREKLDLFKSIREFAPLVELDEDVQKALIGSTIMCKSEFTEIWFSVLQSHAKVGDNGHLLPGTKLKGGAYRIEHKIANGGQGVVYRAIDTENNLVVLKEFILVADESLEVMLESAKDFENETKIMRGLNHPHIVKLIDMFHENGRMYIVLEHIEGDSLREMVDAKGALEASKVLELGAQMSEILTYLHSQTPAIVHRDFTPENLILQPNGKLKLIDFSVAQEKSKNVAAQCAGKHAYTPPEQFRGDAVPQSDLYACGATLYFLATGNDPEAITRSSLPVTSDLLAQKLSQIIMSATALQTHDRIPTAEWLRAEILNSNPEHCVETCTS